MNPFKRMTLRVITLPYFALVSAVSVIRFARDSDVEKAEPVTLIGGFQLWLELTAARFENWIISSTAEGQRVVEDMIEQLEKQAQA